MPVVHFHLIEGRSTGAQHERLLLEASQLFAEVLRCPVERVRAFIHLHRPALVAVGGIPASRGPVEAAYFSFVVMEGRPVSDRHRLLAGFTDLLVGILGAPRESVRGGVVPVSPDDWAIGGRPASAVRAEEVAARAAAGRGEPPT